MKRDPSCARSRSSVVAFVVAPALGLAVGSGCASYEPKPLSVQELSASIDRRASEPLPIAPEDIPEARARGRVFDLRDGWNLYELEIVALYQNPELKAARDDVHISEGVLVAAGRLPNPIISDTSVLAPLGPGTASFAVNLALPILTAGKRRIARDGASADIRRAEAAVESREWNVTREVAAHYWHLRYAEERARLEAENVALAERSLSIAQARLEAEDTSQLDVDLATSELAARQSRVQTLLADKASETYELARLLGLPPAAEFRWDAPEDLYESRDVSTPAGELEALALDSRADLREAREHYAVSESALELAVAGASPDLEIGPGFEKTGGEPARAGLFFGLPLPLFDQNQGLIAQRTAERERAAHEFEALLVRAKQEIRTALSRRDTLERAVVLYREQVLPRLENALDRSQSAYEAGQIGAIDLLAVQQNLARARTEALDLLSARRDASIALERSVGTNLPPSH
ncbi:MAG: TolC family protein [Planctomycetes bacterium]|nr:TolC family protein [Planctomycetota bacterium]